MPAVLSSHPLPRHLFVWIALLTALVSCRSDGDRDAMEGANDATGAGPRALEDADVQDAIVTDAEIEAAFALDPRVAPSRVDAEVEAGIVTLTGVVETLNARDAAEETPKLTKRKVRAVSRTLSRSARDRDREGTSNS